MSKNVVGQYENFAKENKGMYRVDSIDCNEFEVLCKKENVEKYPTFRIYPAYPAPTQDYQEETIDFDKLKKMANKFITSRVIEITQNNYEAFKNDNPGKPKVLLFTDKKGTPVLYKALSSHFDKTLLFGLIRDSEQRLVAKYKVKNYPAIYLIKDNESKAQKYEGTDFSYQAIFDFINIYSETFVFRNSDEEVKSSASKPWLNEKVPQFTSDSANDICLKKESALCVIYIVKDAASKSNEVSEQLYSTGQSFASKISRGVNFYFMWLDASAEPDFFKVFNIESENLPKVVILNPGKRKRFLVHDKDITEGDISATLDKILGGDAKFTNVKGNELPALVTKYPVA